MQSKHMWPAFAFREIVDEDLRAEALLPAWTLETFATGRACYAKESFRNEDWSPRQKKKSYPATSVA